MGSGNRDVTTFIHYMIKVTMILNTAIAAGTQNKQLYFPATLTHNTNTVSEGKHLQRRRFETKPEE